MGPIDGAALATGLALGAASLLSIGPSSLMMIREGLRGTTLWKVGVLVLGSELSLLFVACFLTEEISDSLASVRSVSTCLGAAAVAWFAAGSFRAALRRREGPDAPSFDRRAGQAMMRRVLPVIWLNPLTYVDLVLIPAALCRSYPAAASRLQFGLGIGVMTIAACCACLLAGAFLASLLRRRHVMRMFDAASGVLLTGIAINMTREMLAVPL